MAATAEVREARRRIRLLEQGNEVLRRAAGYLSQGNLPLVRHTLLSFALKQSPAGGGAEPTMGTLPTHSPHRDHLSISTGIARPARPR